MQKILLVALIFFASSFCYGQEVSEKIKGLWTIYKFQPAGINGMTNQIAQMYVGDTIIIDNLISKKIEENEFTKKMGLTGIKCKYNPIRTETIKNSESFFAENFKIKQILLGIDHNKEVFNIHTDCKETPYKNLFYNQENDEIFINEEGMFFMLKRIRK